MSRKKRNWKRMCCIMVVMLGVAATITGFGITHLKKTVDQTMNLVQPIDREEIKDMTNENLSEETIVKLWDNWTVAAFGLDSRNNKSLKTGNSDVIMLMTLDGKTGAIKLASVYRDTCLKTGKNTYKKANAAYAAGGPKQAVAMLNENLDLKIDDYVAVNWKSVADAINILGGVDLEVTDAEFLYLNSFITETVESTGIPSVHLKKAGPNHLDGVQAVAYCRLRLMDDDFKRTERQQKVLNLVLQKAIKADFATLNQLIVTILPQVASSIETEDLYAIAKNITKLHIAGTTGFPSERFVKTVEGVSYVFPDDLAANVSALHMFLYDSEDYQPSKQVRQIGAAVQKKSEKNAVKGEKTIKQTPSNSIIEKETKAETTEAPSLPEESTEEILVIDASTFETEAANVVPEPTSEQIPENTEAAIAEERPEHYGSGYQINDKQTEAFVEKETPSNMEIGPGVEVVETEPGNVSGTETVLMTEEE